MKSKIIMGTATALAAVRRTPLLLSWPMALRKPANEIGCARACENTDKEIWRKKEGDDYSPSIHVTKAGGIGINVGGHAIVMPVEQWHALGRLRCALDDLNRE